MHAARKWCQLIVLCLLLASLTTACSILNPVDTAAPGESGQVIGSSPPLQTSPAAGGQLLKIGLVLMDDGNDARAAAARRGVQLALTQNEYMIAGIQVELIDASDQLAVTSALTAAAAAEQLISENEVHVLIGGLTPETAVAAAAVAADAAVPFVSLVANDVDLGLASQFVFFTKAPEVDQAAAMARYARSDMGAVTAAIGFDLASDASYQLAQAFQHAFTRWGGAVNQMAGLVAGKELESARVEEHLSEMVANPPDVWYLPVPIDLAGELIRMSRSVGVNPQVLGISAWQDTGSLSTAGSGVNGVLFPAAFHPERPVPVTTEFVSEFKEMFAEDPTIEAALAYDAVNRVLWSIESALASDRLDLLDLAASRIALEALLRQPGEYNGVTGRWLIQNPAEMTKSITIVRLEPGAVPPTQYVGEVMP